jgi:hypothetical protein
VIKPVTASAPRAKAISPTISSSPQILPTLASV